MRLSIPSLIIFALGIARPAAALTTSELRERSVYQVFTDRFARSDDQVTYCNTGNRDYCGGTWKGVERNLDYIARMGFDTSGSGPVRESDGSMDLARRSKRGARR